jgi:hypothetical protein
MSLSPWAASEAKHLPLQHTPRAGIRIAPKWISLWLHNRCVGVFRMTNRIALWLGVVLIGLIAADLMLVGNKHLVFLGKKMVDLIEWMAFWR